MDQNYFLEWLNRETLEPVGKEKIARTFTPAQAAGFQNCLNQEDLNRRDLLGRIRRMEKIDHIIDPQKYHYKMSQTSVNREGD